MTSDTGRGSLRYLDAFHGAAVLLAERYGLSTEYVMTDEPHYKKIATIEAVTHELGHAAILNLRSNNCSVQIGEILRDLPDQTANTHELTVLRVEDTVLRSLGMPINSQNFAKIAKWRGTKTPSASKMTRALSRIELQLANQLVYSMQQAVIAFLLRTSGQTRINPQ